MRVKCPAASAHNSNVRPLLRNNIYSLETRLAPHELLSFLRGSRQSEGKTNPNLPPPQMPGPQTCCRRIQNCCRRILKRMKENSIEKKDSKNLCPTFRMPGRRKHDYTVVIVSSTSPEALPVTASSAPAKKRSNPAPPSNSLVLPSWMAFRGITVVKGGIKDRTLAPNR